MIFRSILRGLWISYSLFNILDRDEANAMIMPIDNQQLFDAPLMQEATCILLTDARLHGRKIILRHQFPHGLLRVFGETHVAMSEDTDQLPVILHKDRKSTRLNSSH